MRTQHKCGQKANVALASPTNQIEGEPDCTQNLHRHPHKAHSNIVAEHDEQKNEIIEAEERSVVVECGILPIIGNSICAVLYVRDKVLDCR